MNDPLRKLTVTGQRFTKIRQGASKLKKIRIPGDRMVIPAVFYTKGL